MRIRKVILAPLMQVSNLFCKDCRDSVKFLTIPLTESSCSVSRVIDGSVPHNINEALSMTTSGPPSRHAFHMVVGDIEQEICNIDYLIRFLVSQHGHLQEIVSGSSVLMRNPSPRS